MSKTESLDQGAQWEKVFRVLDENNLPVSISSCVGQIRKTYSDPTIIATMRYETITIDSNLYQRMYLTPEDTAAIAVDPARGQALNPTPYVFDIFVDYGSDDIEKLFSGVINVNPQVTKPS